MPIAHCEITIEAGLDIILSHFEPPIWPRTISTNTTDGRQVLVYNEQQAIAMFKRANLLNCKINAYPSYTEWNALNRQAPNFIFIDLDLSQFISRLALDRTLQKTLNFIKQKLGVDAQPTVIWSGNGYHIYIPIQAFILESENIFAEFEHASRKFIQFAEQFLSNKKADPCHSNGLSFRNCMLRLPGSYNPKLVEFGDKDQILNIPSHAVVRVVQCWNDLRPSIRPLLAEFYIYHADATVKEMNAKRRREQVKKFKSFGSTNNNNRIDWIEKLLNRPLDEFRKYCIWRIFIPYLVNIRRLASEEALNITKEWLTKCNSVRRLDFNAIQRIDEALDTVGNYYPISCINLKTENELLYLRLKIEGILI